MSKIMAKLDHEGKPWRCSECGAVLGIVTKLNGTTRLVISTDESAVVLIGTSQVHCKCGAARTWSASEELLDRLLDRLAERRPSDFE